MRIKNVPDIFWQEIQRKYNALGIREDNEMWDEDEHIGEFYELYDYITRKTGETWYQSEALQEMLLSLKDNEYTITKNSIKIHAGILKNLTIEDIVFIKEFNIQTIQNFVKIISSHKTDLVKEYPHLTEFINNIRPRDMDIVIQPLLQGFQKELPQWALDIIYRPVEKRFSKGRSDY